MNKNLLITLISINTSNPSVCTQSLLAICNEILGSCNSFIKFTLNIGISGMHTSPLEILQAYNEAQVAFSGNFYNHNCVSFYTAKTEIQCDNISIEPHKYIDKIIGNIQQRNVEEAISILLELIEQYRSIEQSVDQVKVSSMLLCSLCYKLLVNYKLDIPNFKEKESGIYKQIQESKSIQHLSDIVTDVVKKTSQIISSNEKQCNYLVKEVNKFIHDNYNKNINLSSIAEYVHVNSSYLSRLYKKETGDSVINVINKYRIEKAKILLKDPCNKIYEVALKIGIDDPSYFTQVFIKYVGIGPKEYKNM